MKIVIDENIPFAEEFFGSLGELVKVPGRSIPGDALAKADALIIRSVTRISEDLLNSAPCLKFVGTCTIGTDHVDAGLLSQRGIAFKSAPGCNRISVGQYVMSSLFFLGEKENISLRNRSIGIIGGGNTGSSVEFYAKLLDMDVKVYDPYLQTGGSPRERKYVSFQEALDSDIVTFHVPLTRDGEYPTLHMFSGEVINSVRSGTVLVNASRGDVWDNAALLERMKDRGDLTLIMDVWEHEPEVLIPLIGHTLISTPHIAGYSTEGKLRGTSMIAFEFCHHFGLGADLPQENELLGISDAAVRHSCGSFEETLRAYALDVYNPLRDSLIFREKYRDPASFDLMRKKYPGRREWSSIRISIDNAELKSRMSEAGFTVV